jgi:hypothetical protein
MERYVELRFDRMVFCGSIVRRDYDWDARIKGEQGRAVLNEYSAKDLWAKMAEWGIADAGASGHRGFETSAPEVYQRARPQFRHSDYFYPLNYSQNWIPFLRGAELSKPPVERRRRANWRFRIVAALTVLAVLAMVLFRFIRRR